MKFHFLIVWAVFFWSYLVLNLNIQDLIYAAIPTVLVYVLILLGERHAEKNSETTYSQ